MKFKKILTGFMVYAITLTIGIIPSAASFVSADDYLGEDEYLYEDDYWNEDNNSDENESNEDYTPIYTIEDLYAIRNDLGGNYILMNDIDMTEDTAPGGDWDMDGHGWEPIGGNTGLWHKDLFYGIFNGNGHKIIGMNIHGDVEYYSVGLFGEVSGAHIYNLGMADVNIDVNVDSVYDIGVGAICGLGNAYIDSCFLTGKVKASVHGGEFHVGSIAGGKNAGASNCYNAADVEAISRGSSYNTVSGITYSSANYCYSVGNLNGFAVFDCFGVAYSHKKSYYLKNSVIRPEYPYVDDDSKELSVVQMKMKSVFGWDFDKTWVIDSTSSYKYPQLRNCMQVPVTSISVVSAPTKTEYGLGSSDIDVTGGVISVYHEADDTTAEIEMTKDMVKSCDMNTPGKKSIEVNYLGASANFEIDVLPCEHKLEHETWGKCIKCDGIPNVVDISKAKVEASDLLPAYDEPGYIELFETVTYDGCVLVRDVDYVIPEDKIIMEDIFGECKFTIEGIGAFNGENSGSCMVYCYHEYDEWTNKCQKCGVINGDVSGNGKTDLYDAIAIAKSLLGKLKFTREEELIADYNRDGKVDLYDAIEIAKYLIKNKF